MAAIISERTDGLAKMSPKQALDSWTIWPTPQKGGGQSGVRHD